MHMLRTLILSGVFFVLHTEDILHSWIQNKISRHENGMIYVAQMSFVNLAHNYSQVCLILLLLT